MTARRHQEVRALVTQMFDRGLPPLTGRAAFYLEDPGAVHADAEAGKRGNDPIEDVGREPSRALVMLGHRIIVPATIQKPRRSCSEGRHSCPIEISRIRPDGAGGEAANLGYGLF